MLRDYPDREDKLIRFHVNRIELLCLGKESLSKNLVREDLIPANLWGGVDMGVDISICEYSLGYPFSTIKTKIEVAIEDYTKTLNASNTYGLSSYSLLRLVSMAILVEVGDYHWGLLVDKWQECGEYGKLIGLLLKYRSPAASAKHETFIDERYEKLLNTFEVDDPFELEKQLKAYVKKWYVRHKSLEWYNSHTRDDIIAYFGYWSFETAAVAKVRGIDLTGTTLGEYFPYSFFGREEQPSKVKVIKTATNPKELSPTRIAYPKLSKLTVEIGTTWINESKERLGLITPDEELECVGTVYTSTDVNFKDFVQTRHNTLLKKMPWYKLVDDSKVRKLPIGDVNEQLMQGVWQGDSDPTSYLVYALAFDKYFMGLTFTFMTKDQQKYVPIIESLLASIRYE